MRLVLFDVDGTLIDSQAIIHEAMRITFCRWGYREPAISDTRSIIGLTLDTAIATMLNRVVDDEIIEMSADYKEVYLQLSVKKEMQSVAFDGIYDLVNRLSVQPDIRLGLVTGKSRRGVAKLLATPEFDMRFSVARCADDCPSKPHPAMVLQCCEELAIDPAATLVVGDTSFDMEMARAAGATAIGVGWGYHAAERILKSGAAAIAWNTASLDKMISNWLSEGGLRLEANDTDRCEHSLPVIGLQQFEYA